MIEVSAPAGSGKTILLRSWIDDGQLADRAAWVSVQSREGDAQRFWLAVLNALRETTPGSSLVRELTAAPGLDTGKIVERLLDDLGALEGRIWLVIDDVHQLRSPDALRQLELFLMRAPAQLRFVLVSRRDLRLGLHRLRLDGGLTEIRADDLRFTLDQARELFRIVGVELSDSALALLHERTEGWAAGLRLAALSLSGHPDPERFAAEFSGSERTVAEYLLAEVLERQPEEVRRVLLRTSMLDRVNGPLADALTGGSEGARILHDLEQANAFVVSLDAARTWFRYHHLFADLLALELRRTAPAELPALHAAAARWFAEHGYPVEAVRHAQTAEDWGLAARMLCDNWFGLRLEGHAAIGHELLAAFPQEIVQENPELVGLVAAKELDDGSLEEAERYLNLAAQNLSSVPTQRREHFQLRLATRRLRISRLRADLPTVIEEAQQLLARAEGPAPLELEAEQRAVTLIELGIAETYAGQLDEAERHLEQGIALARQANRPYLELVALAHGSFTALTRSYLLGEKRSRQAIELAQRHGWSEEQITSVAYIMLAGVMCTQGRLEETTRWIERAEQSFRPELEPAVGISLHWTQGTAALLRGRPDHALDAFAAAERLTERLLTPRLDMTPMRALKLQALVQLGQSDRAEVALAEMDEAQRDTTCMRSAIATLRLTADDPKAASVALEPVMSGSVAASHPIWLVEAFVLEAIARDALGDAGAAQRALEHALDLAEPQGMVLPFLLHPAREILERQARHATTHAALVTDIMSLLAAEPVPARVDGPERLREPLSESETRVLRYLPTNLSLRDIGNELYVSVHTIKTHTKHIYAKLDAHGRAEAVERARGLGLLGPSRGTDRALSR